MQVTLVVYYGDKPLPLRALIQELQEELQTLFGNAFEAYSVGQIHATLIGLEGFRHGSNILNANYEALRGERRMMNLTQAIAHLKTTSHLPFTVQIGGFITSKPYPFTSRGQHPSVRSFSIQTGTDQAGLAGNAVMMGWPVQSERYPMTLDILRKTLNTCHVLHKYHPRIDSVDNDFFMVLGHLDRSLITDEAATAAQTAMRNRLAGREPIKVPVTLESLSLVLYEDPRLPWGQCQTIPLSKALDAVDKILSAYPEGTSSEC